MAFSNQKRKAVAKTTAGFTTTRRGQPDFAQLLSSEDEQLNDQRGMVDDLGSVSKACSIKFIHALCMELLRARSFRYVTVTDITSTEQQKARLEFLEHEFERLFKYQALFPSPDIKARFLALISMDGCLSFDTVCANLLIEKEWQKYDGIWREKHNRPSYLKDSHGWENFLLNGAPGLPGQAQKTSPISSYQAIPQPAFRILTEYMSDQSEILDFIESSPPDFEIHRAPTTLMVDFDNPHPPDARFPMAETEHVTFSNAIGRNPFHDWKQVEHDPVRSGSDRLEDFSALGHRIDQLPRGANALQAPLHAPNLFAFAPMRTFHAPLDRTQLKFPGENTQSNRF